MGIPFSGSFGKKVGNGWDTSFWEDIWRGSVSFKERFNRAYQLEINKRVKVAERGEWEEGAWKWKWEWRREPRGREVGEIEDLIRVIGGSGPNGEMKDRATWVLDPYNGYSVGGVRKLLEDKRRELEVNLTNTTWIKAIPKKVCIFLWRTKLGRIPTREALDKMGIDLDNTLCPRCGKEVETTDHALVTCEQVKSLWNLIGSWWSIDVNSANSFQDIIETTNGDTNAKGSQRWNAVVWSTLYFVWINRNKVIFEKANGNLTNRFQEIQMKTFEWITKRDPNLATDWIGWLTNPKTT